MSFDIEKFLFCAVILTGIISLLDVLFLAPKRKLLHHANMPWYSDYARSFFPILLIVFLLRSFLFEAFRIPSGSLEPTLTRGDFILVNKYHYGLRMPVLHHQLTTGEPVSRGDILVFRWPPNPSVNFIKRVIGLPGDHIRYENKILYVNGIKIPQHLIEVKTVLNDYNEEWESTRMEESLLGIEHSIYLDASKNSQDYHDILVPPHQYFVMGDNRDYSADSRYFGFVPEKNIVGKAVLILFSWDFQHWTMRWNRSGKVIH